MQKLVSIIMPTLDEQDTIQQACESIYNQDSVKENPESFEFILVDSGSTDDTVDIASNYVDRVIEAGRGKLTARNLATEKSKGDIIVAVDADCYYVQGWIDEIIEPFNNTSVVGVRGRTIHADPAYAWNRMWTLVEDIDMQLIHTNRMQGRNCAYTKDGFYNAGGFNESIDQLHVETVMGEEEIGFGNRLAKLGIIQYNPEAVCLHLHLGADKMLCRLITRIPGYSGDCDKYGLGKERF